MEYNLQIFTDNITPKAVNQIYELLRQPPFQNEKVRIMPDAHAGILLRQCQIWSSLMS